MNLSEKLLLTQGIYLILEEYLSLMSTIFFHTYQLEKQALTSKEFRMTNIKGLYYTVKNQDILDDII